MCEKISAPREVLLSKDSCRAEWFLCWRGQCHGDLYHPRWVYNTSREKHTGQLIKREIEDLYKLYFEICQKNFCFKSTDTLNFLVTLVIYLAYHFSTMVYIYGSSVNLLNKRYCITPFHVDVVFLGGRKSLKKHKQERPFKKTTPLFSSQFCFLYFSFPILFIFHFSSLTVFVYPQWQQNISFFQFYVFSWTPIITSFL